MTRRSVWEYGIALAASAVVWSCGPAHPAATTAQGSSLSHGTAPQHDRTSSFAPQSREVPTSEVQLALESTRRVLSPAERFWLAATLRPPSGTSIYWKNPGESGLATTARFDLPDQFEGSGVHYPGPVRWTSDRGATSYGYDTATALWIEVTAPARLPEVASFRVTASWLSCGIVCVRETSHAELRLASDDSPQSEAAPSSATSAELAKWQRELPSSAPSIESQWLDDHRVRLATEDGTQLLEYFPETPFELDDQAPLNQPNPNDGSLLVTIRRHQALTEHTGVVRAVRNGDAHYLTVRFTQPSRPPRSSSAEDSGGLAPPE